MRKFALLAACAVATAALAGDGRIYAIVVSDPVWLNSSECELGTDESSCQLEAHAKAYLREHPVWINPNP
jgi:hypothetical protein